MFYRTGSVGVRIGDSGHGGSNNVFLNNCAGGCTTGLSTTGDQALNNSYIGGNMQSFATGILVTRGSVSSVMGTGFQLSSGWDIQTATTAAAAPISVIGCRSEIAEIGMEPAHMVRRSSDWAHEYSLRQ